MRYFSKSHRPSLIHHASLPRGFKPSKILASIARNKRVKNNMYSSFSISPSEELISALQTICKHNNLSSDELIMTSIIKEIHMYSPEERNDTGIFYSKSIPIEIDLPGELKTDEMKTLALFQRGTDNKCNTGIEEMYCAYDENDIGKFSVNGPSKITFWIIKGVQEVYPVFMPAFVFRKQDYPKFHKIILKRSMFHKCVDAPILPANVLAEIYENTIGFLKRGHEIYKKYNIPFKRGIILAGSAGLGKTMCMRWLKELCKKNRLESKVVTYQEYRQVMSCNGGIDVLFHPFRKGKKGIVFFDDLDVLLTDRKTGNSGVLDFLSGLDGIQVREGIVYVFATNEIEGLDKAAIRPNRIDLFIRMKKPDDKLRLEFINKKFPQEILEKIDIDTLITETDDVSFAELEEIRRLFCIDLIESREIKLEKILNVFKTHRKEFPSRPFGFKDQISEEDEDNYSGMMPDFEND